MSIKHDSCMVQKLSHYIDLNEKSIRQLKKLEESERPFSQGDVLYEGGRKNDKLYVVKKGWLYSYSDLADGRRQIMRIHHPGDIIGFHDIAFDQKTLELMAVEDVVVCPFPKEGLHAIFSESPQLTALLFTLAVRDKASLLDMLKALGRLNAVERIAFLFLDLISKLRITNTSMTDTFRLPLSQAEIGDTLGLTNVYVCKCLPKMEDQGLIRRDGDYVTLLDEPRLIELCEFFDRYDNVDTSWFPGIYQGDH